MNNQEVEIKMEIKDIAAYITSAYKECSVYVYDSVPNTFARQDVSKAVDQFGQKKTVFSVIV